MKISAINNIGISAKMSYLPALILESPFQNDNYYHRRIGSTRATVYTGYQSATKHKSIWHLPKDPRVDRHNIFWGWWIMVNVNEHIHPLSHVNNKRIREMIFSQKHCCVQILYCIIWWFFGCRQQLDHIKVVKVYIAWNCHSPHNNITTTSTIELSFDENS